MKPIDHLINQLKLVRADILQCGSDPIYIGGWGLICTLGKLRIIAACSNGWDHISVSLEDRVPTYEEMKRVKELFFLPDEWAMELHAPAKDHINVHPHVLHLWRPLCTPIPIPPREMV